MKTAIAYILTVFGLPVAVASIISFALDLLFLTILKKANSKILWFIFSSSTEMLAGFAMVWFSIILFSWLKVPLSIFMPIALSIPVIIWNWERIRKHIGVDSFWDELASGIGNIFGLVIGAIYFLMSNAKW